MGTINTRLRFPKASGIFRTFLTQSIKWLYREGLNLINDDNKNKSTNAK